MPDWLLITLTLLAVAVGLWWPLRPLNWWEVMPNSASAGQHKSLPGFAKGSNTSEAGEFHTEDDDWADELHAINIQTSHKIWSWFQQKMVPVSEVTHYEVEALIRTLAVPEWVPGRYRMAA